MWWRTHLDPFQEVFKAHVLVALPARHEGALVDDVGQLSSRAVGGDLGQELRGLLPGHTNHGHPGEVHHEDVAATGFVRKRHSDAAREAARAKEGGVERVGAVGGGEDEDARTTLEAVELRGGTGGGGRMAGLVEGDCGGGRACLEGCAQGA